MSWTLPFISEEDFTNHVKATIDKYGEKLESFDIVRFNKNIIDPIKMIFFFKTQFLLSKQINKKCSCFKNIISPLIYSYI